MPLDKTVRKGNDFPQIHENELYIGFFYRDDISSEKVRFFRGLFSSEGVSAVQVIFGMV